MSKTNPAKRYTLGRIFLRAFLTLVLGFIGWCIWDAKISPWVSTLGKHRSDPAFLYTSTNGNRSVTVLGFSPDGSRFLTSGRKHAVIHDTATGDKITEVEDHWKDGGFELTGDRSVITARYRTPDGVHQLKIFNWDGELINTIDADDGVSFSSVAMIAKLKGGFASLESGHLTLRRVDGSLITQLPEKAVSTRLISSLDGNTVVVFGFGSETLRIWRLDNLGGNITLGGFKFHRVQISDDGNRLVGNSDTEVRVWDTTNGKVISTFSSEGSELDACAISRDGKLVAGSDEAGNILIANADSGNILHRFENKMSPGTLAFSANADRILAGMTYTSTVSGGEQLFTGTRSNNNSQVIRQSENRISTTPGYAIAWSLKK